MAIARLNMKVGKAGKAQPHAAYIARVGQYANRLEKGERLEAAESGNMPAWAQSNPLLFWEAADAHERANGTTYREMEIALPREMTPEQRIDLTREWVAQEIGDRHAFQWAIHVPLAADGGEQPHLHLMFSERQLDGVERDPDQYFKRYNSKTPDRGGARKGYGANAGQTLSKAERVDELKALRTRWEAKCNDHMERAGRAQRIDMRSYAEQGRADEPEAKQLPSQWRNPQQRANVIEFRAAKAALRTARIAVKSLIPNLWAALMQFDTERKERPVRQAIITQVRAAHPERTQRADPIRKEFEGDALLWISKAVTDEKQKLLEHRYRYNELEQSTHRDSKSPLWKASVDLKHANDAFRDKNETLEAWHKAHKLRSLLGVGGQEHNQYYEAAIKAEAAQEKAQAQYDALLHERNTGMAEAQKHLVITEQRLNMLTALQEEQCQIDLAIAAALPHSREGIREGIRKQEEAERVRQEKEAEARRQEVRQKTRLRDRTRGGGIEF